MTDDNEKPSPEELEKMQSFWDKKLASGEPMVSYEFHLAMDVFVGTAGDITIDCPCFGLAGFDRLGVVRVRLTPEAASSLRRGLRDLEKSQGEPPEEPPKQFSY